MSTTAERCQCTCRPQGVWREHRRRYSLPVQVSINNAPFVFCSVVAFSPWLFTPSAGRTGRLVFTKLQEDRRFHPVAVVRTDGIAKKLIKGTHCGLDQVVVCDVTQLKSSDPPKCVGAKAMIICTSAVPVISIRSLIQNTLKIPWNLLRGKKAVDFRSLRFKFKRNQYPEKVDYEGQVMQIDMAKQLGVEHVVVVSSMGGTDPDNFLNKVGKKPDGTGNGDILLWKRKAEQYLVQVSRGFDGPARHRIH